MLYLPKSEITRKLCFIVNVLEADYSVVPKLNQDSTVLSLVAKEKQKLYANEKGGLPKENSWFGKGQNCQESAKLVTFEGGACQNLKSRGLIKRRKYDIY